MEKDISAFQVLTKYRFPEPEVTHEFSRVLSARNPFSILGVDQYLASHQALKEARNRLLQSLHPDKLGSTSGDFVETNNHIVQIINEAYDATENITLDFYDVVYKRFDEKNRIGRKRFAQMEHIDQLSAMLELMLSYEMRDAFGGITDSLDAAIFASGNIIEDTASRVDLIKEAYKVGLRRLPAINHVLEVLGQSRNRPERVPRILRDENGMTFRATEFTHSARSMGIQNLYIEQDKFYFHLPLSDGTISSRPNTPNSVYIYSFDGDLLPGNWFKEFIRINGITNNAVQRAAQSKHRAQFKQKQLESARKHQQDEPEPGLFSRITAGFHYFFRGPQNIK